MYRQWPFFQALIDNLQMALAKADIQIAAEYAGLVSDAALSERIFAEIRAEYARTREVVLNITGDAEILANSQAIQTSVQLRNPYVDALSCFQVLLLRALRTARQHEAAQAEANDVASDPAPGTVGQATERPDEEETMQRVLLTINGIASGLRNTG